MTAIGIRMRGSVCLFFLSLGWEYLHSGGRVSALGLRRGAFENLAPTDQFLAPGDGLSAAAEGDCDGPPGSVATPAGGDAEAGNPQAGLATPDVPNVDSSSSTPPPEAASEPSEDEEVDMLKKALVTDEKGKVNKDVEKAYEAALKVAGSNTRVRLAYDVDHHLTRKLTGQWPVEQLYDLHADFDAEIFYAQIRLYSDTLNKFRATYLTGVDEGRKILENIPAFIAEFENIDSLRGLFAAFRMANVHLYNSAGRAVNNIGMSNFNTMVNFSEDLTHAIADIKHVLRGLNDADYKRLLSDRAAAPYSPFLRALRADYPSEPERIVTAKTFAAAAIKDWEALRAEKALELAVLQGMFPFLGADSKLRGEAMGTATQLNTLMASTLRWSAYIHAMRKPNLMSDSAGGGGAGAALYDGATGAAVGRNYYYVNALYNVPASVSSAVRGAVAASLPPLYKEYIAFRGRLHQASGGALPMALGEVASRRLLPSSDAVTRTLLRRESLAWTEIDRLSTLAVLHFAPSLGDQIKLLKEEGRVMWDTAEKPHERTTEARLQPGGHKGPVLLCEVDEKEGVVAVPYFALAYTRAAMFRLQRRESLVSKMRPLVLHAISQAASEYYSDALVERTVEKALVEKNHLPFLIAAAAAHEGIFGLQRAAAADDFETRVFALAAALGDVRRLNPRASSPTIDAEALQTAWAMALNTNLEIPELLMLENEKHVVHPENVNLFFDNSHKAAAYSLERRNHVDILRYCFVLALKDAIQNAAGIEQRNQVVERLVRAPSTAGFADYIKLVGGDPESGDYWRRVLDRSFTRHMKTVREGADKYAASQIKQARDAIPMPHAGAAEAATQ